MPIFQPRGILTLELDDLTIFNISPLQSLMGCWTGTRNFGRIHKASSDASINFSPEIKIFLICLHQNPRLWNLQGKLYHCQWDVTITLCAFHIYQVLFPFINVFLSYVRTSNFLGDDFLPHVLEAQAVIIIQSDFQ